MSEMTKTTDRIHSLLTPDNCVVTLIDHPPQMLFGVNSIVPHHRLHCTDATHRLRGSVPCRNTKSLTMSWSYPEIVE
jgi:hypothetical protein